MRRDGAPAAEIELVTRELERECRRAKRNFLKKAITDEDWRGIRLVKPFQAAQSRIQNAAGQIAASSQRSQVLPNSTATCNFRKLSCLHSPTEQHCMMQPRYQKLILVLRNSDAQKRR